MTSHAARMSPSRKGSCSGIAPSRKPRAFSGSPYPRLTRTLAVVSERPSAPAKAVTSGRRHGVSLHVPSYMEETVEPGSDGILRPRVRDELPLRRRLRRRVPGVSLQLQPDGFRAARERSCSKARARRVGRARRGRDGRSRGANGARAHCRAPERARRLPRPQLGAPLGHGERIARLLAQKVDLSRRVARPPGQGEPARGRLGRTELGVRLPGSPGRPSPARAGPGSFLARPSVPPLTGSITGLDHAFITIASDGEDAGRAFYGSLLGLEEIPKPAGLSESPGVWFRAGDEELHLGVDELH